MTSPAEVAAPVVLSTDEALQVDLAMAAHMDRHRVSNSPLSWSCDAGCRVEALRRAVEPVVAARVRQALAEPLAGGSAGSADGSADGSAGGAVGGVAGVQA